MFFVIRQLKFVYHNMHVGYTGQPVVVNIAF